MVLPGTDCDNLWVDDLVQHDNNKSWWQLSVRLFHIFMEGGLIKCFSYRDVELRPGHGPLFIFVNSNRNYIKCREYLHCYEENLLCHKIIAGRYIFARFLFWKTKVQYSSSSKVWEKVFALCFPQVIMSSTLYRLHNKKAKMFFVRLSTWSALIDDRLKLAFWRKLFLFFHTLCSFRKRNLEIEIRSLYVWFKVIEKQVGCSPWSYHFISVKTIRFFLLMSQEKIWLRCKNSWRFFRWCFSQKIGGDVYLGFSLFLFISLLCSCLRWYRPQIGLLWLPNSDLHVRNLIWIDWECPKIVSILTFGYQKYA